jgi:hypothetical protein
MTEGLLDRRTSFGWARVEAGLLEGAHVFDVDAALLFAVGDPTGFHPQVMLLPNPILDLLVAGRLQRSSPFAHYSQCFP